MIFTDDNAYDLELIIRKMINCGCDDFAGIIKNTWIQQHPFEYGLIAIEPVFKTVDQQQLNEFIGKWSTVFRYPDENGNRDSTGHEYITELRALLASANSGT